jgi:ubiquinone/menaquinone biosynthesis C-methylase UbiE
MALSVIKAINPQRECKGIEPTNDLLDIWNLRNLNVVNGSATDIPFENDHFDMVFSSHVLEHIDDDFSAVKEIFRVTKKRALIIVPAGNCDDKNMGTPHLRYYNRVNFKTLIENAAATAKCDIDFQYHSHHLINSLIAIIDFK